MCRLSALITIGTGGGLEAVVCERKEQRVYIAESWSNPQLDHASLQNNHLRRCALSPVLADSPFLRCSPGRVSAGGVGKSALVERFVNDTFLSNYDPTIEGLLFLPAARPGTDDFLQTEVYECSTQVDGTSYSVRVPPGSKKHPPALTDPSPFSSKS